MNNEVHPSAHELHMACTTVELALSDELHTSLKRCSDISATDISFTDVSAWTFWPRKFWPRKMPKVDISAITINFGFGLCACINV